MIKSKKGISFTVEAVIAAFIIITTLLFLFRAQPHYPTYMSDVREMGFRCLKALDNQGVLREYAMNNRISDIENDLADCLAPLNITVQICRNGCTATSTLYEGYNIGDDDQFPIYFNFWRAQTFTVGNTGANENHQVTSVKLKSYRFSGSPGNVTVGIRATNETGFPIGEDLTNGTTDGNTLPPGAPYEWREIDLTPYELSADTKYAIVVRAIDGNSLNTIQWRANSSGSYTGGSAYSSDTGGTYWTENTSFDFMFEEYGIPTNTTTVYSQDTIISKYYIAGEEEPDPLYVKLIMWFE